MREWLYPGAKVVCHDDNFSDGDRHPDIVCGRIYVVSQVFDKGHALDIGPYRESPLVVVLQGVKACRGRRGGFLGLPNSDAFNAARFRPLQKRKTDISVFTRLLTPSPREKADA